MLQQSAVQFADGYDLAYFNISRLCLTAAATYATTGGDAGVESLKHVSSVRTGDQLKAVRPECSCRAALWRATGGTPCWQLRVAGLA